jgi:hypothetical protein
VASSHRLNEPTPAVAPYASARLLSITITVSYPDKSKKTQTWYPTTIAETYKLALSEALLQGPDAQLLKRGSDWRHNPCMVRFLRSDGQSQPICQLGGRRRRATIKKRSQRGSPDRFDLTVSHGSDAPVRITLDRAYLDETAVLLFPPQEDLTADEQSRWFSSSDWRQNAVLIRVKNDGTREGIFPQSRTLAEGLRMSLADDQCGIGSPARNESR